jgi:TonB-dependent SusC/RagA subfamily outer membrane receptor
VQFTIPINFSLKKDDEVKKVDSVPRVRVTDTLSKKLSNGGIDMRNYRSMLPDPLFVIDGIIADKATFDKMDANTIESFSVLKDATAKIYGAKAANGVILIITKKHQKELNKNK